MKIKAILFDMDGVLVDSEHFHCKSYIKALEKYGIYLTEEEYFLEWTRQGKGIRDFLIKRGIKLNAEEIREVKREIYHQMLREHLKPMEGMRELLDELDKTFKLALVSSSYKVDIELILELTKLEKYFDCIVAKDDVSKIKPDPEAFLLAAKKLNVRPEECIVVEDAEKGVIAAKKGGMKCIAIPCKYTMDNDFSGANTVVRNVQELKKRIYFLSSGSV